MICLLFFVAIPKPVILVMISGMMQAFMLPMLAVAALYYRYYRCDSRLRPGKVWDTFLWISSIGMLITGLWLLYEVVKPFLE
jgi:hypothetical protein